MYFIQSNEINSSKEELNWFIYLLINKVSNTHLHVVLPDRWMWEAFQFKGMIYKNMWNVNKKYKIPFTHTK